MKNKYIIKVKNNIIEYVKSNYQKVSLEDMEMGEGLFNNRCQWNSVQTAEKGNADEVYLCVVIDKSNSPFIHFINKKDDKYIDNTLGYLYKECSYYIIKKVEKCEYGETVNLLYETKRTLLNLNSNKIINKIFKIDEEII